MKCRICYETKGNIVELKCKCTDEDLKYIHQECAEQGYKDRVDITWTGKLTQENWVMKRSCLCEICNNFINGELVLNIFNKFANNTSILKILGINK